MGDKIKGDKINGDKYQFNNSIIGSVGKNTQSPSTRPENSSDASNQSIHSEKIKKELKELVANGKIEPSIKSLSEFFKSNGNTEGLNSTILLSASYFELQQKEQFNLINENETVVQKNKIVQSFLRIIDLHLK